LVKLETESSDKSNTFELTIELEIGLIVGAGQRVLHCSTFLDFLKEKHCPRNDTIICNGFFINVVSEAGELCSVTYKVSSFSSLFNVHSTGSRSFLALEWFEAFGYLC